MTTPGSYTFHAWQRRGGATLAATGVDGRARGKVALTATASTGEQANDTVDFALYGPADVQGLLPGAVTACYPRPGEPQAEITFCPYVEFAEPDLPWRYSPDGAGADGQMRPWPALLAVTADEFVPLGDGTVELGVALQQSHPLGKSAWSAHVQLYPGSDRQVGRVLCLRRLEQHPTGSAEHPTGSVLACLSPDTTYHALLVPAFAADGTARWDGTKSVRVPVLYHWVFRTVAGETDFRALAEQLHAAPGHQQFGRVPVRIGPELTGGTAVTVQVRGALTGIADPDGPRPDQAAARLAALLRFDPDHTCGGSTDPNCRGKDAAGRPYLRPPVYGGAWRARPLDGAPAGGWVREIDEDPRHRAVAGLGLSAATALQDEITSAAAERAGATAAANQRISALVAGLAAARSLWQVRGPASPSDQLRTFGLALGRIAATGDDPAREEPLLDLVAGGHRTLPRALFTSAARRVLRPGAARYRHTAPGALDDAGLFAAANTERPAVHRPAEAHGDPRLTRGVAHADLLARALRNVGGRPVRNSDELMAALGGNDRSPAVTAASKRFGTPHRRPPRPVDLVKLAAVLTRAFDPTTDPVAVPRVLATIDPPDPQPLAPREPCLPLDVAVWSWLRDTGREWLLPGAHTLADGDVVGLAANPVFVDAFLTGANTQALGELRWHNLRLPTGCTPLRRFWDRYAPSATDPNALRQDTDIIGIDSWTGPPDSTDPATDPRRLPLGDDSHGPGGTARRRLVVAFRTDLFRRYPGTLVYLAPQQNDWQQADISQGARKEPAFAARITPSLLLFAFDIDPPSLATTYFVVVEQAPPGFRFRSSAMPHPNDGTVAGPSQSVAAASLDPPVRVLLNGRDLAGGA
ncbi:hypothetical protein KV557_31455 [Kitasatospora aureofaciens]|uniref:hypothetical protein n=1 Tax=Kitasatospora aureofaciens TaxID=1894 RepID=UPI001C441CC1|nr:hypothetical protein [Kitasatospora aureofaciens]MBV6701577.1 hypothetical protein [Kitasatospora aureofaciens]